MDSDELERKFSVTAEDLEERAKAYESGNWPPGKTTRMGRPPFSDDDQLESVTFRIPKSRIRAINMVTEQCGKSRSEFLREAVDKALRDSA